ncbi:SNF1-interacting protein [Mortierella alpina]|nr:SNF1-interacting protein [Mortierella alpina]
MGNTSTKDKTDHVDGGELLPHGIYTGPQDYDFRIVQRLILQRKLAPFYKGLEDWDDSEDAQEEKEKQQLLQQQQQQQQQQQKQQQQRQRGTTATRASSSSSSNTSTGHSHSHSQSSGHNVARGSSSNSSHAHADRHLTEAEREKKRLYQGAIECPICFLYYPRNTNRTRCCDKPICTECFVQIKRLESAATESPACPYCVESHFGIIYSPALLSTGLMSPSPSMTGQTVGGTSMSVSSSNNSIERGPDGQTPSSPSTRRRSTSHKSPEVVSADDLRPDWNRRILAAAQRQPGSRRASTSSSNAAFGLGRRWAAGRQAGTSSRRSNSSAAAGDYTGYLTAMRNMGADLEELMIMEAMRQSLQDEQDRQAREASATATADSPSQASQRSRTESGSGTDDGSRASRGSSSPSSSTVDQAGSSSLAQEARVSSPMRQEQGPDSESEASISEPESDLDSPALLHNRAIRYASATIPARPNPVEASTPKHRAPEGATPPSEAV